VQLKTKKKITAYYLFSVRIRGRCNYQWWASRYFNRTVFICRQKYND